MNKQVIPIFSGVEPHPCPFKIELNGDYDTLCTCTPDEESKCAEDI